MLQADATICPVFHTKLEAPPPSSAGSNGLKSIDVPLWSFFFFHRHTFPRLKKEKRESRFQWSAPEIRRFQVDLIFFFSPFDVSQQHWMFIRLELIAQRMFWLLFTFIHVLEFIYSWHSVAHSPLFFFSLFLPSKNSSTCSHWPLYRLVRRYLLTPRTVWKRKEPHKKISFSFSSRHLLFGQTTHGEEEGNIFTSYRQHWNVLIQTL